MASTSSSCNHPVTTAVMKVNLHCCEGCNKKIRITVGKTKGVQEIFMDEQMNLMIVKGAMDMKALAESLSKKIRRPVKIVQGGLKGWWGLRQSGSRRPGSV